MSKTRKTYKHFHLGECHLRRAGTLMIYISKNGFFWMKKEKGATDVIIEDRDHWMIREGSGSYAYTHGGSSFKAACELWWDEYQE